MVNVGGARQRAAGSWRELRRDLVGYAYVAPAVVLIAIFSVVSIAISLYVSLNNWDILSGKIHFVGLQNFQAILTRDDVFWIAARNTATFVLLVVPLVTILSVTFAALVNEIRRGKPVFRAIFFLPTVTPMVILALIWLWLYAPDGPLNRLLAVVGLPTPNWLQDQNTALLAIVLMTVWHAVGYDMVIFSAALADVPPEIYAAAKVDGAGGFQTFISITVPLLRNAIAFVAIVLTIGAFQVFTQVYVMTDGGPANSTEVIQALIYKNGFRFFNMGYAAAMSWLLFVVIFIFTFAQLRWFRSGQIY